MRALSRTQARAASRGAIRQRSRHETISSLLQSVRLDDCCGQHHVGRVATNIMSQFMSYPSASNCLLGNGQSAQFRARCDGPGTRCKILCSNRDDSAR